jgi:hypothetical protein
MDFDFLARSKPLQGGDAKHRKERASSNEKASSLEFFIDDAAMS